MDELFDGEYFQVKPDYKRAVVHPMIEEAEG